LPQVPADYYVGQLRDWKGAVEVANLDPTGLTFYGELCARTLARAHARSGDRVAIAAYRPQGRLRAAIADFTMVYADRNQRHYAALERAAAAGVVTVTTRSE
jgi:hypothetical protein